MRVWLDDLRDPTDPQHQRNKGASKDMVWVKTVSEAIELLKTGEVTYISLDNDLGSGLEEGRKVADWIEEQAFLGSLKKLKLKAHTDNVDAKWRMHAAFRNAHRAWKSLDAALSLPEDVSRSNP